MLDDEGSVDDGRQEKRLVAMLRVLGIVAGDLVKIQHPAGRSPGQGIEKTNGSISSQNKCPEYDNR
jgi:hypothetical protein